MENRECPFCSLPQSKILRESETCMVIHDGYPVTHLHTLIITKRHAKTYYDLNAEERRDVEVHLENEREIILAADPLVTGFNIGINCGASAGQTIFHFHCHVIPRYIGDMDEPEGGVRGVIPEKMKY